MSKSFFVDKDFDSRYPKIHTPRNYLQSFYMAALIDEWGTKNNCPLAMFWNSISKNTILSCIGMMDNVIRSLSSDSAITSKENKNRRATFKIQMKINCFLLNQRMMHFLRIGKQTCLCTKSIEGHAQIWGGKIISLETWVWNGSLWSPSRKLTV